MGKTQKPPLTAYCPFVIAPPAHFVDVDDVRMIQPGGGLGFAAKAGDLFRTSEATRMDQLERDDAAEADLPGAIDLSHAAVAEEFEQFVVAEAVDAWRGSFRVRAWLRRHAQEAARALVAGDVSQEERTAYGTPDWLG